MPSAAQIKSMYPKYNGWNDEASIIADYNAGNAGGMGGGGGSVNFPTFNFDFAAEQEKAYQQLKPFYDKMLDFAKGDLDLAKRMINYTYEQGTRESTQQAEQETAQNKLLFPTETNQLQTTQNQRGILSSGFGNTERERLKQSQALRQEAVQRALENRQSRLTSEQGFGTEQKNRGFEQSQFDQERQKRKEASDLALQKFGIESTKYNMEFNKAQAEEQRRQQALQNAALSNTYGKFT